MFELNDIEELLNQINLPRLYEIAKDSAQIGNEILKINYNKIQKISSKGRRGDLVTNVDLEVENKIKEYLVEETPNISFALRKTAGPPMVQPTPLINIAVFSGPTVTATRP